MDNNEIDYAISDLSSVRDFIRWAFTCFKNADLFYGHGTDNAWDEAVALILQSLNLPFDTPDFILQSKLTFLEKTLLSQRIQKRINKKIPVAYLTNKAFFCGSEYFVDQRVLVPRSPIAELIENQFSPWIEAQEVNSILDLCTGSGCIAIACSQYFPEATVHGSDISADCINVAQINKMRLKQQNVSFYRSDLFKQISPQKYDIIVANPPYVDQQDFTQIPQEFLAEPELGLTSGVDGLQLTKKLLKQARDYLSDDGILIVEVGNSAAALESDFPNVAFTWLEFERGGEGVFLLSQQQLASI